MSNLPILETQKYSLTIPSTKERIEIRPYFIKEEKQLLIALESNDSDIILKSIRDICIACSFDKLNPSKHTEFDLEYLFIHLRARSVGETANIQIACSECNENNVTSLDLTQVTVPDMEPDAHKIQLTDSVHIIMKHPTINQLVEFETIQFDNNIDQVFAKMSLYIDQIHHGDNIFYAVDNSQAEVTAFIEQLPSKTFQKLNTFYEAIPRIQHNIEFTCSDCEKENKILVEGYQNFFV